MIHVRRTDQALRRPATRQVRGAGRDQFRRRARARSSGCWDPTGPARPRRCGSSARCCSPPPARPRSTATTCVTQPSQVRHQIGFMSANTAVYDRMTPGRWSSISAGCTASPTSELDRADGRRSSTGCKMNDIRDLLGAKMSTGMKQKVSIARAIVHDPPVLIFDEATAGLDVLVARALLKTVAELRDQGKCILFSTHIMREAEKLCDRIAIMHRGQILAEGTLDELRERHHEQRPGGVVLPVDLAARRSPSAGDSANAG